MTCKCGAPDDQSCRPGCDEVELAQARNREQRMYDALQLTARHAHQVSVTFFRGMAMRMAVSYEKYGDYREAYPDKLDALASAEARVAKYRATGNTEYLIDAANFLMIEFMAPRKVGATFIPTDSDGSIGRVTRAGTTTESANTTGRENLRRGGSHWRTDGGFYRHEGD